MPVFEIGKQQTIREGLQFDPNDATAQEKVHIDSILQWKGDGFDLRTHITDPKSGMLLKFQPYRRVCNGSDVFYFRKDENGIERRYSGSGVLLDHIMPADTQLRNNAETTSELKVHNDKRVSR